MNRRSLVNLLNYPLSFSFNKDFLLKLALTIFIVISFSFNETGLMPIAVVFLLGVFIFFRNPISILNKISGQYPKEVKLLNIWFILASISGIFTSINIDGFISGITSLFFIILIVNLLCCVLLYDIRLVKVVFFAIILSGLIQIAAIYLGFSDVVNERSGRQMGLANNPNSLGLKMVYAALGVLVFMGLKKTLNIFFILISVGALILFFNTILNSGSKKSLISFFILLCFSLAIIIGNRSTKLNIKKVFILLIILAITSYFLLPILLEGSIVGDRFKDLDQQGGIESDERVIMYKYGIELFLEYPLLGVGINNYRYHYSGGLYSHSDYIESLTSTGFLGFIIYQSLYLLVILRGIRLMYVVNDKIIRIYVVIGVLSIIVLKIIGLGIILYTSPSAMIILTIFSVIIHRVMIDYKREQGHI